jgi:hypothetical protein
VNGQARPHDQALATLGGVMTDLAQVTVRLRTRPCETEPVVQLLDRLAAEVTEAAAILRAAPARPSAQPGVLSQPI